MSYPRHRQLGSWAMGKGVSAQRDLEEDATVHACDAPCALLHFNAFKGCGLAMQAASGSCSAWEGVLDKIALAHGQRAKDMNVTGFVPTRASDECPDLRTQIWRERFLRNSDERLHVGLRKWFRGCCRP